MIDKTVLELVDRLVATNNRAAIAERDLEAAKKVIGKDIEEMDSLKAQISELTEEIAKLKDDIENKQNSVSFWYKEAQKYEKELKEGSSKCTELTAERDALAKEVEKLKAQLNTSMGLEAADRGLL